MKQGLWIFPWALIGFLSAQTFNPPKPMVVSAAVADVRSEPAPRKLIIAYDEKQETQVEIGDPVMVYERNGDWARVEAPDQPEYTHNDRWQGYPGWVEWKSLTKEIKKLKAFSSIKMKEDELRVEILKQASRHLGESYLWGGRSLFDPKVKNVLTGVDCSGLVNWSFRQMGIRIPRDAHEQFMRAHPVDPKLLKPADLIFLSKTDKPDKVVHVAFYAGGEELLEAPQTGEKVRRISFQDRFGKKLSELKSGDVLGDRIIHFGTLFVEGIWPN